MNLAYLYRIFEKATVGNLALFAGVGSLLIYTIDDLTNLPLGIPILGFGVVSIVVFLLVGRKFGPRIKLEEFDQWEHENHLTLRNDGQINARNGIAQVEMLFSVPNHHNELYISFEIDSLEVGITQAAPVNFDGSKAVTYHNKIDEFGLVLLLDPENVESSKSKIPLEIKDKLNNKIIEELEILV